MTQLRMNSAGICLVLTALCFAPADALSEGTPPTATVVKAITATSQADGIKLSQKAVERIGLEFIKVPASGSVTIPSSALVRSLAVVGVYRLRNEWFKLLPIEIIRQSGGMAVVQSSDLRSGDQIVVRGVALLRAAEMDAFGGGE